ncbi:peptidase M20 [Asticcacaulis sp. AC460]|uniref:M20/M25/M40 family metallo-hydrolase n=1 Tax=Asticcacaulis sp. AC460 TaxID=1282360 RepID=UPI0003C3FC2F|nr:M20/M25/M40 family metallo-hydrolase [Asticcacaulis sp. AC460]ESQ88184.1 peptidase M20 [Asticcacaulis sp. AC460]
MKTSLIALAAALLFAAPAVAADKSGDGWPAFRDLYKELVETNTQHSDGSCTLATERMAARLKAAGYSDADLHLYAPADAPKDGLLVATLQGTDTKANGILLIAHIDVVEAKRSDWQRDPYSLIEEDGYFYGRGTTDDKAQAAIFVDTLIRYKQEGYKPKKSIKVALTCGEETEGVFNGARYLSTERKDWIDADFAINEGASGELDAQGKRVAMNIEAAQKVYQDFTLTATNKGGHSSRPRPDNAIYAMADALKKVQAYSFPVMLNDANRAYFTRTAKLRGGEIGAAMTAIVANPNDAAAAATLSQDASLNATLRTTCVATLINGGHAPNALPGTVTTNVNCRIFPGVPVETVQAALVAAINDPAIKVETDGHRSPATPTPKMPPEILGPIEKVSAEIYGPVPVIPVMTLGATDSIHTSAAGIPSYGFRGMFVDPDGGNAHGLNERIQVQSVVDGRRLFYKLIKIYAGGK